MITRSDNPSVHSELFLESTRMVFLAYVVYLRSWVNDQCRREAIRSIFLCSFAIRKTLYRSCMTSVDSAAPSPNTLRADLHSAVRNLEVDFGPRLQLRGTHHIRNCTSICEVLHHHSVPIQVHPRDRRIRTADPWLAALGEKDHSIGGLCTCFRSRRLFQ
jgi:hypothetical protein